jgi:hypothetical protein
VFIFDVRKLSASRTLRQPKRRISLSNMSGMIHAVSPALVCFLSLLPDRKPGHRPAEARLSEQSGLFRDRVPAKDRLWSVSAANATPMKYMVTICFCNIFPTF